MFDFTYEAVINKHQEIIDLLQIDRKMFFIQNQSNYIVKMCNHFLSNFKFDEDFIEQKQIKRLSNLI